MGPQPPCFGERELGLARSLLLPRRRFGQSGRAQGAHLGPRPELPPRALHLERREHLVGRREYLLAGARLPLLGLGSASPPPMGDKKMMSIMENILLRGHGTPAQSSVELT